MEQRGVPKFQLFLAFVLSNAACLLHAANVPALFIFGDSLIDVGNNNYINSLAKADVRYNGIDYNHGVPTGRFCNGRTIPDFLGEYLEVPPPPAYLTPNLTIKDISRGLNYASGAGGVLDATGANYVSSHPCQVLLPHCCLVFQIARLSFNQQLVYFAGTKQRYVTELGMDAANKFLADSIYMVAFGANDYINNYLVTFSPTPSLYNTSQFQDMLISTYSQQISRLYDLGARKMVVFGVGPLGCIPNQLMRTTDQKCNPQVNSYVQGFNAALQRQLSGILLKQLPKVRFAYAHGYDRFIDMVKSPASYGFKVTDEGCCGLGRLNGLLACMPISNLCSNRKEYLFWDPFHPTEAANMVIATDFYNGTTAYASPINVEELASVSAVV
ncbi:GDSL esterase/lipase 7 isoform X2 [Selaginella moellendorffii]|nr:GDSL esterase/lipase 7 isoform X2 [Selaginella moellendorffii]XP_024526421.1 GDSL esterase/lipase 7 isoform X2 [Selaginella moellendorffii]|eukprot:XP_024526415.1 GDSL esterase/lipase 7 isoform X2 [Selaginella moellendorffii]